ncbi:MAG: GntR family transcriptional regulator [Chloroflexi bacterium]|nr:GntR family transcriptional regulator [Chloroflexota bacterium]
MTSAEQSAAEPSAAEGAAAEGAAAEGAAVGNDGRPAVDGGRSSMRATRAVGGKTGARAGAARPREAPALVRLQRQPSLTERVFRQLRDAIVNAEFAPGDVVTIEHVAAMLGVSRTPVREAMPALQQLGLIVQADNGSFQVAPLDTTYVWEVYAVRSALESLAAEIVAPTLSDGDLDDLRSSALPPEPRPDGDYSEMFGPDLGLHDFVRRKCPLGFLNALIDVVQVHRSRLLDLEHSASGSYRRASYEEHRAIVEALERRDGKLARQRMQAHLDRVGTEVAALAERGGEALPDHVREGRQGGEQARRAQR